MHTLQTALAPAWKETNFNVNNKLFSCVATMLSKSSRFGKKAAAAIVVRVVDKFGDAKLKAAISALLIEMTDALGPTWVLDRIGKELGTVKSPKALGEVPHARACACMRECMHAQVLDWCQLVVKSVKSDQQ